MAKSKDPDAEATPPPAGLLARVRAWSAANPLRNALVGIGLGAASIATIVSWLTVAEIAAAPDEFTVPRAIELLDAGEEDRAREIVLKLVEEDTLPQDDYGGALFVMGSLKVREAERQWSPDRSRTDYFVASKYLTESRAFGFPEGREGEGLYLLGRSLIESRQLEPGIEALQRALDSGARGQAPAHLLLAEAYFYTPKPSYREALTEIDAATADPEITAGDRSSAALLRSETLSALGDGEGARRAALDAGESADATRRALAEGRALVTQLATAEAQDRKELAERAIAALDRARQADQGTTSMSRESDYLRAWVAELTGRRDEAIAALGELRRAHGASEPGIAAALAEGELRQQDGDDKGALEAYRRALDAIDNPANYRSRLLPLSEVRRRVVAAHKRLLERGRYPEALDLSDWVGRVVGSTEQLHLRATTLSRWGDELLARGVERGARGAGDLRLGRAKLREAGVAHERLAEARFATRRFPDDLWESAGAFERGQAYGEAIRVLDRYLRAEPVLRNAQALLKLGEAQFARGDDEAAIQTFAECLDFHESDPSSYRVRLLSAQAHRNRGEFAEAERMLRHNLNRTALTPASPEWRDSKFELGRLLADAGRHEDAVAELEEAVSRFPDTPQGRGARYQIALSNREAARAPLERLRTAKTVSEREQARRESADRLEAALAMFESVQREVTLADSADELDRATLRNCFMLGGNVLFELERYEEARQSFANVSTLYQNEPYMLEALLQIYHCWRRQSDRLKALGVVQQAQQLLQRLPPETDFASSTNLSRAEWDRLLSQLATL